MFNLISFFFALAIICLPFIENVLLRKHHKEQLQKRFQTWWESVEHQDKLHFAVSCAALAGRWLDRFFGENLLWSKRLWRRSFAVSSSLLVITLSFVGFWSKEPFWLQPWRNYNQSVALVTNAVNVLFSDKSMEHFYQLNFTNKPPVVNETNTAIVRINTNLFLFSIQQDNLIHVTNFIPINHGGITVEYNRVTSSDTNDVSTNIPPSEQLVGSIQELRKGAYSIRDYAVRHSTPLSVVTYSVLYFVSLLLLNGLLFIGSLLLCRVTLREIVAAKRTIATISLIISNLTAIFLTSSVVLFCFTILALPIFWLFLIFLYRWSEESIYTTLMYCSASTLAMWISSGVSPKLIALISFVPSFFAILVGGVSAFAIKWKKPFHYIVKSVLIRCAETSPFVIILGTMIFISAALTLVAKWLHLTAFL